MNISRLFYYPVKSLQGIEVNRLKFDKFGAVNDRRFMLVDKAGNFVTQRQHPILALVKISAVEGGYQVFMPDVGDFFLPMRGERHEQMTVTVWDDALNAYVQPEWTSRFTHYLGAETQLVYMADDAERGIDKDYCEQHRVVSFVDGFPLLFCTEGSLNFLNENLKQSIDIERFRPNVVVSGVEAFSEMQWQSLEVKGHKFDAVKPCSRCVIPTINPQTAQRQPEVFKALQQFCKGEDGNVYFGQNVIHSDCDAEIAVGDELVATLSP